MKRTLFVILMLISANSMALRFNSIDAKDIVNPEFKSLIQQWQADFNIDDAGAYGYQVKKLNRSGQWDKTVRNIAYIKSYCLDEIAANPVEYISYIYPDTKELIYNMAYLDLPNTERAVESLAAKYSDMIESLYVNDDFMILEGFSSCDSFSAGHDEITIIDKKNKQYFVLYGGYSE